MSEKELVRQRAFGAVLQRAVFSWQVALTVVVTLLLVVGFGCLAVALQRVYLLHRI
jgi:hypothetical protein